MLYYDAETESFWLQVTGTAVVGPLTGAKLKWMPSEVTTWKDWRTRHPKTTVLKPPLDPRRYAMTHKAYGKYRSSDRMMFPVGPDPISDKYRRKENVTIVLRGDGQARCYPHPELDEGENRDGDFKVVKKGIRVRVLDREGKVVPSMLAYWYAWCSFYPKGTVYTRKQD